jgi:AraC-like DNA-binding protein
MPKATTPAQYLLILLDLAEQAGCDRGDLLAGTTLSDSGTARIGARVEDRDFIQVAQNALLLTGDAALGLQLGLRLNLSAHALLGQAFMTCRDLREAIELFLKYYHLLSSNLEMSFEDDGLQCCLTAAEPYQELPRHFSYELLFGAMLNTLRGLLNLPELTLQLEAPYPPPAHAEEYHQLLGDQVRFDSDTGRIRFPSALLDTSLPSSNPALRELYEQECARLLADLEEEDSVSHQTLRLLRKLEGQYPQMPQIAEMLNLSPRTYRRRLQSEDSSFQDLLDHVRAEHATRYLQHTRLPLASIAYLVGFNDTSNFRRAYTKWTGRSPGEVRRGN